jgi:hypothetical protein
MEHMSETKLIRPNQVTMAGWMIMVGSVIVVLTVFDQVAGLRSVEVREGVEKFLSEPPGKGLGLTVDGTLGIIRALLLIAAGCATAAAILGWQVLRRDRTARLALTVLAVPLFVTGIVAGGFFSALVAAASLMLWSQPARDWFDGVTRPQEPVAGRSTGGGGEGGVSTGSAGDGPGPHVPVAPSPYANFGVAPPAPPPMSRPDQIVWSAALTWIFCGLTSILLAASAFVLAGDSDSIIAEVRKQQPSVDEAALSDSTIIAMVVVMIALCLVWAIAASVVAAFVWRGREWARITLMVSALLAGAVSIVGVVAGGVTLPLLVASGVVFRLLLGRQATAWCRRPRPVATR